MKKILAIVLSAAALLLTLAGCGPKTASAGNASGGNAYYASAGNASGGHASAATPLCLRVGYYLYGNASSGNAG